MSISTVTVTLSIPASASVPALGVLHLYGVIENRAEMLSCPEISAVNFTFSQIPAHISKPFGADSDA